MKLGLLVHRTAYRIAHRMLRVYWFIARPENEGVKCVITDGDRVLLVRHTYGRPEWDLPGGGLKRGESAVDTARREMHEELGVRIEDWRALGDVKLRPYHSRDTLHCFRAEIHDPALTIDPVELATARWFARRELPDDVGRQVGKILALVDGTHDALSSSTRAAADSGASR